MPDVTEVLDSVQKEVKRFGDDVKSLKDSMMRDLEQVRKTADEAKGFAGEGTQLKADLKALAEGVAAKHEAIEKTVKEIEEKALKAAQDRMDEVERKLNRARLLPGLGGEADEIKGYRDFTTAALASRGQLNSNTDLSDDKIDVEGIKAYAGSFNRYARRGETALSSDERKAMLVGDDSNGGYFVPVAMSPRILTSIIETSPMRALATIETISTDTLELAVDEDEAGAGWVGETSARPETSTPRVGTQKIVVHEQYANPKVTQKLLEDASVDVEAWLGRKIGERFGRLEATAFFTGNGVGKPRGILTYAAGTARGTIEQVNLGGASDVTADGLIRLMIALKDEYVAGANWLMRRNTVGNVMLLKDANDQYIWRPGLEAGKPSILLGAEVRQAADMPAVASNALAIAFGNFRQAYTIVDRLGISTLRDPFTAKPWVMFYTRRRVGGDVTNFDAVKIGKIST